MREHFKGLVVAVRIIVHRQATMERKSSRWRVMKPLEWLKAIYETFGTPYPRVSLIAVMLICAIFGGAVWLFAAKQVAKDHGTVLNAQPQVSGPASTTGPNSPANTGNGNDIRYDQSSNHEKKPPPKKE